MNNNAHIVKYLSEKMQLPLQTVDNVFEILVDLIIKELSEGNDLQLPGFGQLEVKSLSGRKTVFFKPSAEFTTT